MQLLYKHWFEIATVVRDRVVVWDEFQRKQKHFPSLSRIQRHFSLPPQKCRNHYRPANQRWALAFERLKIPSVKHELTTAISDLIHMQGSRQTSYTYLVHSLGML